MGREKALFPEESLFYNYSDGEDRSILFADLVRFRASRCGVAELRR